MEESVMIQPLVGFPSFFIPLFFIAISAGIAHFFSSRNWFGKRFERSHLFLSILILFFLLVAGIGTSIGAETMGIHDTQEVGVVVETIQHEPISGTVLIGVSALGEELFFRGIVYTILGIISIPLFALVHAGYSSLTQIAAALIGGTVLYFARQKTGSIYPGLLGHFLYNILAVFFIPF